MCVQIYFSELNLEFGIIFQSFTKHHGPFCAFTTPFAIVRPRGIAALKNETLQFQIEISQSRPNKLHADNPTLINLMASNYKPAM
ncbi:hypothetical protein LAZ67_1001382 [Cordylochernes scorpioides]|uniref:Uncharacterized protein n=1 Tax=Cordylochernes scorpioides TaxID=51811 RepID=A0ABY6JVP0_9ARAC|nr:hypothetical protein LAZ67_1001382 [Cordylochernes scorpioides]